MILLPCPRSQSQETPPSTQDGAIVESFSGHQYGSFEEWLQAEKKRYVFDEAAFRKQFPPGEFENYREKIECPFETYEEWLAVLRTRARKASFTGEEFESRFRLEHSPEEFTAFTETVDCLRLKYMSDGLKVVAFVLKPKQPDGARLPTVIYNRGGHNKRGEHDIGVIDFEKLLSLRFLVSQGYVVVASQYRGGGGSEGLDEIGGADVNDVLNLVPVIESLPFADRERIGVFGWSRGGMMTYLALRRTPRIKAAVIASAPADCADAAGMEAVLAGQVPGFEENRQEALHSRSAVHWVDKIDKRVPILLLHGSEDRSVSAGSALRMATELHSSGHPFRFVLFENGDHGLTQHSEEVQRMIIGWFDKYLKAE